MATLTAATIEIPSNLFTEVKQYAGLANRPIELVVEEALQSYMELPPDDHARSRRFREEAAALGMTPEEYSVHVVKQVRAEMRAEKLAR